MHTPASVERELRRLAKSESVQFRTRAIKDASGLLTFGFVGPSNGKLYQG